MKNAPLLFHTQISSQGKRYRDSQTSHSYVTACVGSSVSLLYSCLGREDMWSVEGPMLPQGAKTLKDSRPGESSYTNSSLLPTSTALRKAPFLSLLFPPHGFEAAHKGKCCPYSHCMEGCLRESKQKASETLARKLCV